MFKYIFILIILFILIYIIKNHVKIKYKTFLKKGYKAQKNYYGIYCYHNKQGSSKTQNCVSYLLNNSHMKIYANLKSLKGIEYYYFSGFNTLLKIGTTDHDCIIFYDELFKGLFKGKKMSQKDKELLMDFMSQMRKRNIILLTTAQEWLEIPIEFRRYVRFDIKCSLKSIFGYPIIIKEFNDTEQIHWDNLENEYVSPRINTIIEHGQKKIVNSYDTFEQISSEEQEPILIYNKIEYNDFFIPTILENTEEKKEKNIDTDFWDELEEEDIEEVL